LLVLRHWLSLPEGTHCIPSAKRGPMLQDISALPTECAFKD
jgi:hypothetical protein